MEHYLFFFIAIFLAFFVLSKLGETDTGKKAEEKFRKIHEGDNTFAQLGSATLLMIIIFGTVMLFVVIAGALS